MLPNLPTELQQRMALEYLSAKDFARMRATCKSIRQALMLPLACGFVLSAEWDPKKCRPPQDHAYIRILPQHGGLRALYDASMAERIEEVSRLDELSDDVVSEEVAQAETPSWAVPDTDETQGHKNPTPVIRNVLLRPRLRFTRYVHTRIPITAAAAFMPYNCPRAPYVEFTILSPNSAGESLPAVDLAIGLVSSTFLYKHNYSPANDPFSVVYENQHGLIYLGHRHGEGFMFGTPYTWGDVIGVGIISDVSTEASTNCSTPPPELLYPQRVQKTCVFFTLNGEWVGDAPFRISSDLSDLSQSLFPAVSFNSSNTPVEVEMNMGDKPFMFDIALSKMQALLNKTDLSAAVQESCRNDSSDVHATACVSVASPSNITRISIEQPMLDRMKNNLASTPGHYLDLRYLKSSVDLRAIQLHGPSLFTLESSTVPKSINARGEVPPTIEQVDEGSIFHVTWSGSRYLNVRPVQSPQPLARPCSFDAIEGTRPPAGSYFEVTVLENGGTLRELDADGNVLADDEEWILAGRDFPDRDIGFLGIGLAMRPYSSFNHVGWDFGSFGLHSDDGKLFDGCLQGGFPWDGPYTLGDVVGVGLDANGDVFVTKNGSLCGPVVKGRVARIPASHFEWRLHPTVSACMKWKVAVNFGSEEFLFQWSGDSKE